MVVTTSLFYWICLWFWKCEWYHHSRKHRALIWDRLSVYCQDSQTESPITCCQYQTTLYVWESKVLMRTHRFVAAEAWSGTGRICQHFWFWGIEIEIFCDVSMYCFFSRKKSSGYCLHINQRAGGDKSRVLAPEADLSAELSSGNHQSKERGAQGASFLDGSAALHQLLTTAAEVLPKLQKLTPRVRAVQGGLAQVLKEAKAIRLEGSQAGEVEWLNIAHRETIFIQSFCIHFGSWGLPGSPRSPRGWASQGWKEAAALLKWEWQTAVCWC